MSVGREGEVWINSTNLIHDIKKVYARYPDNRQGRRAAERKLAALGIDRDAAEFARTAIPVDKDMAT